MSQPFKHSADSLHSFLSQSGRGFYIPYYQRNYSWDEDNADKLVTDIFSGLKGTLSKPTNSIFLGTIILHDEKNIVVGGHVDTPNLLTRISNVVDGQQRITSIAILACVISNSLATTANKLSSYGFSLTEFSSLVSELQDQQLVIQDLYSIEIKKYGVQPNLKPLIIRAGDVMSNPVSDQWTLAGNGKNFYRSNTSGFISDFINGDPVQSIITDVTVKSAHLAKHSAMRHSSAGRPANDPAAVHRSVWPGDS
jgi:hypothetical protein